MLSVLLAAVLLRELPLGLVWSSDGVITTLTFIFVKVFTVRTLLLHMSLTILRTQRLFPHMILLAPYGGSERFE